MKSVVGGACRLCLLGMFFAATAAHAADAIPLAVEPQKSNQLELRELADGQIEITTAGSDPFMVLKPFDVEKVPADCTVLAFEYFAPEGVDGLTVYYGPPINAHKQLAAGGLQKSQSWQPYAIDLHNLSDGKWTTASNLLRLDFGHKAGVAFRLRNLHLRRLTAEEARSQAERDAERNAKLAVETRINAFYQAEFSCRVTDVSVTEKHVVVRGHTDPANHARLVEIQPHVSISSPATIQNGEFFLDDRNGITDVGELKAGAPFETRLPRRVGDKDRTTSRWAVAERTQDNRWKLRSHWKYATDLSDAAANDLPPQIPKGVKGMGGVSARFPLEELVALGVHNITVNIALTSLMDTTSRRGWIPFTHGGRTWYVNRRLLSSYDKLIRFAAENEIVVSGILVVPFSDRDFGKLLVHPEADRAGHYAMPNFTSPEGVAAYEAVIEFLAQRYAAAGLPHGRIANWIIHNEVGFGWEWTNMGSQPPMVYMDHYLRSMRLVHNVVRRHDPHARVFISLTHHWNTPTDASWRSYSNVELLQRLIESSRSEGDFAWGVAFHPYPQNLRRPDAWNDARLTDDFKTPQITPKNIAVLDRWMHQPQMRDADGNVRGVLLSEQGFNTPDYSDESQRLQAAGLVYMWRQMRGLKSIEAFHNHRWVDHPNEGGLLLGLRKLPSAGKPYGAKKFAWEIYKVLDTPGEAEAVRFADQLIGQPRSP
ncbi:DUF5722 domain-containing protein [Roseimaritima ulvae]|nr:DUF5722 domain-containing protein [Roseimaritima ulvae]